MIPFASECVVCLKVKPVAEFYLHRKRTPFKRCKECHYNTFKKTIPESEKVYYKGRKVTKKMIASYKAKIGKPNLSKITHGMAKTRFWCIYQGIVGRCKYTKGNRYYRYGGRGITNEWSSFEHFRDDMYESYQAHVKEFGEKNTSIDRIDNDGNYCKENCRWATGREQVLNRGYGTKLLTLNGETKHLCEWAEYLGVDKRLIWSRLENGWSVEKALTNKLYGHSKGRRG